MVSTRWPNHKTSPVKQYLVKEFGNKMIGHSDIEGYPPHLPGLTIMGVSYRMPETADICDSFTDIGKILRDILRTVPMYHLYATTCAK